MFAYKNLRNQSFLDSKNKIKETEKVHGDVHQNNVWCLFNGLPLEGNWTQLMEIEVFRQSIMKSSEYLKPYGLDLHEIISSDKKNEISFYTRKNIMISSVCKTAVHIALIDCLNHAGVQIDGMIGLSNGELGCAYADNCLTAQECLLVAYYRGKCIEEANLPEGAMAIVGLTWEQCQIRCPSGVVPAVHNYEGNTTISGPKKDVLEFIHLLEKEGIFVQEMNCGDVAFHSHHIALVSKKLKDCLEKVILKPKMRSHKWISTSITESRWKTADLAKYASADYFVNNLCAPSLFNECLRKVPTNAVVIEIGTGKFFSNILDKTLSPKILRISLPGLNEVDQVKHYWTEMDLLKNIETNNKHYNLRTTTPKPKFLGTQLNVEKFEYTIDVNQEHYLVGHQINGKFVYPVSGFIYLVWRSLAKLNGYQNIEQFPIMFENIQLLNRCPTTVECGKQYQFTVSIHPTTGLFELYESGVMVATGTVYPMEDKTIEMPLHQQTWSTVRHHETLSQDEIYQGLNLKGYEYLNEFQPIIKANIDGTYGELSWTGKWVPFLEGMIQMHLIGQKNGLFYPTQIKSIKIDPRVNFVKQRQDRGISLTHLMSTFTLREEPTVIVPCRVNYLTNLTVCGGIEIYGLVFEQIKQFSNIQIHQRQPMNSRHMPNIEQQQFEKNCRIYNYQTPLVLQKPLESVRTLATDILQDSIDYSLGLTKNRIHSSLRNLNTLVKNPKFFVPKAKCEMYLSPTQTYIINCGTGLFSLEFIRWVVEHGARNIVVTSNVCTKNCTLIREIVKLEQEYGVQIRCLSYDLADLSECFLLVKEATQMGVEKRIGGVFHLDVYQREVSFQYESQYQVRRLISENLLRITGMQGVMDKSAFIIVITNPTEQVPTEYVDMCSTLYKEGKQALTVDWETIGGEYTMLNEYNFGCDNKNEYLYLQQRIADCLVNLEKFLVKNIDFNMFTKYSGYERIQYQGEFDPSMPLVQVIAQICQIKDVDQWRNNDLTLGDLKIDNTMVLQIQSFLNQYIKLNVSEILKLTYISINLIDQLKENPTVLEASVRSLIKYQMPKRNFYNKKYF